MFKWRQICLVALMIALVLGQATVASGQAQRVKLGNEVFLDKYLHLVAGKRVGLVTNHTGVNGEGRSIVEVLATHPSVNLRALYAPEHGLDGKAKAGEYVASYTHPELKIPVYSLYGPTRYPTKEMLDGTDVLLVDIQDIGARTYTYMSTLNYCIVSAQKFGKKVIVLDRPNPLGGMRYDGPMMEDRFITFVGVDNLPMAHGMTAGELARFYNRKIGADLVVIPMEGYRRNMLFQDTGLPWVQTSPNIPTLHSCFGYMATGLGEGTGVFQADQFTWIGGNGLNAEQYALALKEQGLQGVEFIPETRGNAGGVRLNITDYYQFNPARTGIYALATAFRLGNFVVPKSSTSTIVMFDKIMGTDEVGRGLEKQWTGAEIEQGYAKRLAEFGRIRSRYLLPEYDPVIIVKLKGHRLDFDVDPFIDGHNRVQVPLRVIAAALGARVDWNERLKQVILTQSDKQQILSIGSHTIIVNGEERTMDTAPQIVNGRTLVPVRFVAEHLGRPVRWDGDWLMVHLD